MKKTSAKNTASRSAKSTGGRASGRAKRATATPKRAATGGRKAAASSRAATAGKSSKPSAKTAAKSAPKKSTVRSTASKLAAPKTAPRKATRSIAKTAARSNTRATARIKQSSTKDLLMDFFHDEIKDIYWAEKNIVKTLPKMKKAATSPELKAAFDKHAAQSQEHVSRLEEVFQYLGKKAQAKKCDAMEGIIKEGGEIISSTDAGTATRDVGLIFAAQKVEHYEIATYGGLAQLARTLKLDDIVALLETTLQEEKDTDTDLTSIAENHVNYDALHESEGPQASAAAMAAGGDEDDDEEEDDDDDIELDEADIDEEEEEDDDDEVEDLDEDDLEEDEEEEDEEN